MAAIIKTTYTHNEVALVQAMTYIDSINKESYLTEMYSICIKYIREKNENELNDTKKNNYKPMIRDQILAKDENDIFYNKVDGHWIIETEKNKIITLYQRRTLNGIIYNSTLVEKLFSLTYNECSRTVPKVFEKPQTPFENFSKELSEKVIAFRDRLDIIY